MAVLALRATAGAILAAPPGLRHLSESQRAIVAAKLANLPKGANQHASIEAPSQSNAAELLNVSRASVQRAREVLDRGAPELVQAVEQGAIAVDMAAKLTAVEPEFQRAVVAKITDDIRPMEAIAIGSAAKLANLPRWWRSEQAANWRDAHRAGRKHVERRKIVTELVADGHSQRAIAQVLGVDESTVRADKGAGNTALDTVTSLAADDKLRATAVMIPS